MGLGWQPGHRHQVWEWGAASGGAERGRICSFRVPGQAEHREILGRSVVSVL